ncbi:hypothetical protein ISN45_Aa07g034600 [Arabidopsis thaliana x Arabidopsis arenosa]|uniref:Uncharacterized protein n=1 Tax=Arabidopsis thaliana x Arabidopsis arenosa TaxID=1240361 RepID=A0A8T1YBV8_9BRAS|nr:hypothetical protein ISN45_Aa07g034600 [Arabidopsis thaliana x Arabidopsis arenosa]
MATSSSWEMQLMETAKEELEILQSQYPNRFAYLKSDLESFISHLREDHAPPRPSSSSSSVVLTQESSNCKNKQKHKKRKCVMDNFGDQASSSTIGKIHKNNNKIGQRVVTKRKNRVEMVLERAQLCLQKIRDVKASLC